MFLNEYGKEMLQICKDCISAFKFLCCEALHLGHGLSPFLFISWGYQEILLKTLERQRLLGTLSLECWVLLSKCFEVN